MSFFIRPRGAVSVELRIKHRVLKKPFYRTFDSEAEAGAFADTAHRIVFPAIHPIPAILPAQPTPILR